MINLRHRGQELCGPNFALRLRLPACNPPHMLPKPHIQVICPTASQIFRVGDLKPAHFNSR